MLSAVIAMNAAQGAMYAAAGAAAQVQVRNALDAQQAALAQVTGIYSQQMGSTCSCPYCGRKRQAHKHTSCDGCGAPR